jgi:NNP family nitrate/nitrite transporter-like MFS transporter
MVSVPADPALSLRSPRTVLTLVIATVGLGLNLRAWILLGPHLHLRFEVSTGQYALFMGLPLLVAMVVRLPVGVLTDRYGARVMFPAVCLTGAAGVFGLGLAGSLPVALVAGAANGAASCAFVVGAALLSRMFPYGRRGLALGVFSTGPAVAALVPALARGPGLSIRQDAVVLGVALVAVAALAAGVFRDPVGRHHGGQPVRRSLEMVRVACRTSLSPLYAMALGGLLAVAIYLPVYLVAAFELEPASAAAVTGIVVILSTVGRLVGGWWTDRRPTARLLVNCYAVAATLCLVGVVEPRRWWLAGAVIAGAAVCDGLAGGALLALIGKAARTESMGAVMGVTGSVAVLGAVVPPLLLAGVSRLGHSYSAAWAMLAFVLLAAAFYVATHGLRIGLGLSVQFQPGPSVTTMTVVVVGDTDVGFGAPAVVGRLAELASTDELVVVYGSDEPSRPRLSANLLVSGLRQRLPRHSVVAVRAAPRTAGLDQLAAVLDELLEAGTVAIAVAPKSELHDVAAQLSSHLKADRILAVTYTPAVGARTHPVWQRVG